MWHGALALCVLVPLCFLRGVLPLVCGFCAFFMWSSYYLDQVAQAKSYLYPHQVNIVSGTATGLITEREQKYADDKKHQFMLRLSAINKNPITRYPPLFLKLTLPEEEAIQIGETITVVADIAPFQSNLNKANLDFERIAFAQQLMATGSGALVLARSKTPSLLAEIDTIRQHYYTTVVAQIDHPQVGMLVALATGDSRSITAQQWQLFNRSGTVHLISISGSHLSIIAIIVFGLLSVMLSLIAPLRHRSLVKPVALLVSATLVGLYALVAGASIPTVRALFMFYVFIGFQLSKRTMMLPFALTICLVGILLIIPSALLLAGTWLSFIAFTMIVLLAPRFSRYPLLLRALLIQASITLVILPVALLFFDTYALLGTMANLVAIPFIELLLTPIALLSFLYYLAFDALSPLLTSLFLFFSNFFIALLQLLPDHRLVSGVLPERSTVSVLLSLAVAGLLLLAPTRATALKIILLVFPIFISSASSLKPGEFEATIFDIGQGQAVLIKTKNHSLLYDTADMRGQHSYAESTIYPYLRSQGIEALTTVIASHGDADHASGLTFLSSNQLAQTYIVADRYTQDTYLSDHPKPEEIVACKANMEWVWDNVRFSILNPLRYIPGRAANNDSCVLLVQSMRHSFLLLGDISIEGEIALRKRYPSLSVSAVLVGHHGSKTSSHQHFFKALGPSIAYISSGYHNRFSFPHPQVLESLALQNTPFMNTAWCGMIEVRFIQSAMQSSCLRALAQPSWRVVPHQYGGMVLNHTALY